MSKKIYFYSLSGILNKEVELNEESLKNTLGMKVKCIFDDDREEIGYACCNDNYYKNGMVDLFNNYELWKIKNFDVNNSNMIYEQEFKKIDLFNVKSISAILYSSPRWGIPANNNFEFKKNENYSKDIEIPEFIKNRKYTYVYVEYEDDIGGKLYCYRANDKNVEVGCRVVVERNNNEVYAKVVSVKEYDLNDVPYPLDKTKFIKEIVNEESNLDLEIIECKHFYGDDVILSYTLNNAWGRFIDGFMIADKKEYNIVLNGPFATENMKFTIPYEEIKKIKDILNKNNSVFNIKDIPMPSVLDGTEHEFYFASKKNIISFEAFNLWYWLEEDDVPKDVKVILSVVKEINKILKPYDLKIDLGEN